MFSFNISLNSAGFCGPKRRNPHMSWNQVEADNSAARMAWIRSEWTMGECGGVHESGVLSLWVVFGILRGCVSLQVSCRNLIILDIDPGDILAVGISNQRGSCLLWNKRTGNPLCNIIGVWVSPYCVEINGFPIRADISSSQLKSSLLAKFWPLTITVRTFSDFPCYFLVLLCNSSSMDWHKDIIGREKSLILASWKDQLPQIRLWSSHQYVL